MTLTLSDDGKTPSGYFDPVIIKVAPARPRVVTHADGSVTLKYASLEIKSTPEWGGMVFQLASELGMGNITEGAFQRLVGLMPGAEVKP